MSQKAKNIYESASRHAPPPLLLCSIIVYLLPHPGYNVGGGLQRRGLQILAISKSDYTLIFRIA